MSVISLPGGALAAVEPPGHAFDVLRRRRERVGQRRIVQQLAEAALAAADARGDGVEVLHRARTSSLYSASSLVSRPSVPRPLAICVATRSAERDQLVQVAVDRSSVKSLPTVPRPARMSRSSAVASSMPCGRLRRHFGDRRAAAARRDVAPFGNRRALRSTA